jgi:membrane protein DedA with SNARE-associated domain
VAAVAGGVVALGVIYLMGRRHGRKKRTVVEITRI